MKIEIDGKELIGGGIDDCPNCLDERNFCQAHQQAKQYLADKYGQSSPE